MSPTTTRRLPARREPGERGAPSPLVEAERPGAAPPGPSGSAARLAQLDVIRGFALLGVLLSNIHFWFRAPRGHQNLSYSAWPGLANEAATWLVRALVESKSIFLFSMLFGLGLAMQREHVEASGAGFTRYGTRRLIALAGIGLLHVLLLWNGEILVPYGVLGLVSLFFVHRQPRTLWRWVIGLWTLVAVLMLAGPVRTLFGPETASPSLADIAARDVAEGEFISYLASHYLSTSWLEVAKFRIADYPRILKGSIPALIVIFANLLTGMAIWPSGVVQRPSAHLPALRRFARWSLPLGLALHAIWASKGALRMWAVGLPWSVARFQPLVVDLSMLAGALLCSLGLAAALLVLTAEERWQRRLSPLAALGRTAISAYLLQSVAMTAVFYGWGLGYYNRMSPAAGLGLGFTFFAIQLVAATLWVSRFRFGPVEWLWRSITYWRTQPLLMARPD